jgi:hypothetical protein
MLILKERELAIEERKEYDAASPGERGSDRKSYGIDKFIRRKHPDRIATQVAWRSRILLAGDHAMPLWERIATGMPLVTAIRILRESQDEWRAGKHQEDYTGILKRHLSAYDSTGVIRHLNGKQFRASSPSRRATRIAKGESRQPVHTRVHRANVRNAVAAWVAARLAAGLDEAKRDSLVEECMREVEMMLDSFALRMRSERPARSQLYDACDVLNIPRPKWGQRADQERAWKNRKKSLAATHPDSLGHEGGKAAFQAINDAYNVIVAYNDSLTNGEEANAEAT